MLADYRHILTLLLLQIFFYDAIHGMPRTTRSVTLPTTSIGTRHSFVVHNYGPQSGHATNKAYIQATLHADELPGLLVSHHLIKLMDIADKEGSILQEIIIVPYANPIGLSQQLLGTHIGRFSLETGINFNREYVDISPKVANRVEKLLSQDSGRNVKVIREALLEEIEELKIIKGESELKRTLFKMACTCDIVIDLHCDSDAILHMYTNDRLWPSLSDLAGELKTECNLLAPSTGYDSFDEACSWPWADLADRFPQYPIPLGCESVTVELRGESDVYDDIAIQDATALYRFLQRRGYIKADPVPDLGSDSRIDSRIGSGVPPVLREASPLSGVDMVEASKAGIVAWRVRPGDIVKQGQILGEIVDIEDPDTPRTPVISQTDGIVFSMARHKLVRPGQVIIKVAGTKVLEWRTGNLLTSR